MPHDEGGGRKNGGRRKKLKKVKDFVLGDVLGEGASNPVPLPMPTRPSAM